MTDRAGASQSREKGLRLDETKPGSGLGLSIVVDFARFELEPSSEVGLRARLELPAA